MTDEEKKIRKRESDKKYRLENPDKVRAKNAKYRREHKEEIKRYNVEYYGKNTSKKADRKQYLREYYLTHKKEYTSYVKEKRQTNPVFRMKLNLRKRNNYFFQRMGVDKPTNTQGLLGVTYDIVKKHIEDQFVEGMTWENYGKWHIDHIVPLASAKDIDELIALCHYSNLQPLWAEENLEKRDKINWTREKASQTNQPDTIEQSIPER